MPTGAQSPGLAAGLLLILSVACTGEDGEPGPQGPPGQDGVDGFNGLDGFNGSDGVDGLACWDTNGNHACDAATEDENDDGVCDALDCQGVPPGLAYVGAETCKACHTDIAAKFDESGHPYKLTKVEGGVAPTRPFDGVTGGVPDPPLGLAWADVSYVIGGFGWKVRYVDTDGYIITGDTGDATQWNFPNPDLGLIPGSWVAYHPGEERPFDCGGCHTTGWIPCPVGDSSCPHQDGMPGMAGSFAEAGIQCEACHGPGSAHVAAPYLVQPRIDRDPEACGKCHSRAAVESIDASGGYIRHHEQWDEMFQSKKHVMRCIDCHDPHASSKFAHAIVNPHKGIRIACASCHVGYDSNQASAVMQAIVDCSDCHMPRVVKSAVADADQYSGDMRSHLFLINSDYAAAQFSDDGSEAMPYVSLEFACRNCHRDADEPRSGKAYNKTQAELETTATGYHSY